MYFKNKLNKLHNDKVKKRLNSLVDRILEETRVLSRLSTDELVKTFHLTLEQDKGDLDNLDNYTDDTLIKASAIGYIVIERVLGMTLYREQLLGGLALYFNYIIEMKTGEGKTLTSILPVILRAKKGQVHVCTVNEYLCQRDKELLEPVYETLGYSVALNKQSDKLLLKQSSYSCHIIYGTASTFGFDYLNDNMVSTQKAVMDKPKPERKYFALIDEVDLVLIDEARTPLIIGTPSEQPTEQLHLIDSWVKSLLEEDYITDRKHMTIVLTQSGEDKITQYANKGNLYDTENIYLLHLIYQSLVANYVYKQDTDYAIITHKGQRQVAIIDTFTGRIQPDRRFTNGLHQALEAKHSKDNVNIKPETKTVGTITLQRFFKMYQNLSGMTGTAQEEREEFYSVYGLNVIDIPTHRPLNREDRPLILCDNQMAKWTKITEMIRNYHEKGYPVLVGTVSVEASEELSDILTQYHLKHTVLNAKQDKQEAEIIKHAGRRGAITVATNMAGRGTDIKVEDEVPLVVFVTEINEASRIDNQLKGRTSRQGAKGIVETVIASDDTIFVKMGLVRLFKLASQSPLTSHKKIEKLCKTVQEELEGLSSTSRASALKYDDIINEQRTKFYQARNKVLYATETQVFYQYAKDFKIPEYLIDLVIQEHTDTEKQVKLLRDIFLNALDKAWQEHIDRLELLKSVIGWRSQSGHNVNIIYQHEAAVLYDEFLANIQIRLLSSLTAIEKGKTLEFSSAYYKKGDMVDDLVEN